MTRRPLVKLGVGLVIISSVLVLAEFSGLRDLVTSGDLAATIADAGPLAPIIFMAVYALASILFIPGTPLTLIGGALFGPLLGTVYVVLGATAGAFGAFLLARYFGGSLISSGTGQIVERLRTYDQRLSDNGFMTVLVLRLIPLFPFNGLNFGLGLTRINLWVYVLATFVGIMPGTFAYVYFGSSLTSFDPIQIGGAIIGLIAVSFLGKYLLAKTNHKQHAK
ncbi:MAG: TVP38/TMEM64 family protein [Candidatus Pacebacteria bacterium]|nr:TVP38/TMEM64 family protein [Candidatus Paceibacterota bacterium]